MPRSGKNRKVLSNDDSWILHFRNPLTPEIMWDEMIEPHVGSAIDGFIWSSGAYTYNFETEIGERSDSRSPGNLEQFIEKHGGPLAVIPKLCRKAGMDFFPSFRMNQHYDSDMTDKLRLEHPEYLINRGKEPLKGSMEWGIGRGLDFSFEEVRKMKADVILETIERFDVDGVELDFMRHPGYFKVEQAISNAYLITDMVKYIRDGMDKLGEINNKKYDLIVRVPASFSASLGIGLDVETWIEEDLVDIVVAGGGFIPFDSPIHEFVQKASSKNIHIFGCLEGLRPAVDQLTLRAIAANYWNQGIDGIHLFNLYSMSASWKQNELKELSSPDKLKHLDKRYERDRSYSRFGTASHLHMSFRNGIPKTQLPLAIETTLTNQTADVEINVADDIEDAISKNILADCELELLFDGFNDDEISVSINNRNLNWDDAITDPNGWDFVHYKVDTNWNYYPSQLDKKNDEGYCAKWTLNSELIKSGINTIQIKMIKPDSSRIDSLILNNVRLSIKYN